MEFVMELLRELLMNFFFGISEGNLNGTFNKLLSELLMGFLKELLMELLMEWTSDGTNGTFKVETHCSCHPMSTDTVQCEHQHNNGEYLHAAHVEVIGKNAPGQIGNIQTDAIVRHCNRRPEIALD